MFCIKKYFQKQPFTEVLQNRCSEKFCNIYKKTTVLESFFNKAAELAPEILLEKFVNMLTKSHYRIFAMDLTYCYCKYVEAATETYSTK